MNDYDLLYKFRELAASRIPVEADHEVLNFEIYELKFLKPGDPYEPVLKLLFRLDANRNIYCFRHDGEFVWQVGKRHPITSITQTNSFMGDMSLQANGVIEVRTWSGHRYAIDSKSGLLTYVGWSKE